jgi:hypothetical protein
MVVLGGTEDRGGTVVALETDEAGVTPPLCRARTPVVRGDPLAVSPQADTAIAPQTTVAATAEAVLHASGLIVVTVPLLVGPVAPWPLMAPPRR